MAKRHSIPFALKLVLLWVSLLAVVVSVGPNGTGIGGGSTPMVLLFAEARTRNVLNADRWTWKKMLLPHRSYLVKFDVEFPHGLLQDTWLNFTKLHASTTEQLHKKCSATSMSPCGFPPQPLIVEMRTKEASPSQNLPLMNQLGIDGKDDTFPLLWFFAAAPCHCCGGGMKKSAPTQTPKRRNISTPVGGWHNLGHSAIVPFAFDGPPNRQRNVSSYGKGVAPPLTVSSLARWYYDNTGVWLEGLPGTESQAEEWFVGNTTLLGCHGTDSAGTEKGEESISGADRCERVDDDAGPLPASAKPKGTTGKIEFDTARYHAHLHRTLVVPKCSGPLSSLASLSTCVADALSGERERLATLFLSKDVLIEKKMKMIDLKLNVLSSLLVHLVDSGGLSADELQRYC